MANYKVASPTSQPYKQGSPASKKLNGGITHPGKETNTRLTSFMPPPAILLAPRPKFLPLTTSVVVQPFLPLIDGLTAYTFQEKIQLVQEDGYTALSWSKTTI
jgi:hypothetical protein